MRKDSLQTLPKPSLFWASDPVRPDETVLISGEFLGEDCIVEIALRSDTCGAAVSDQVWQEAEIVQFGDQSLKAVVPADIALGIYDCRVRRGDFVSSQLVLNASTPWWCQGDSGPACKQGGWVRVFGKCLDLGQDAQVRFNGSEGSATVTCSASTPYALTATVPVDLAPGRYDISTSNGFGGETAWRSAGQIDVVAADRSEPIVISVLDFGADSEGKRDCTLAIVQAMERLKGVGGGVVYFPAGRYRIDSTLRSGMYIRHPLHVSPGVTLRGEGADIVSLWWPDQPEREPLPSLIEGGQDFAIEDLSIYTQGRHRNIISGESNVRIRRVRIRANCYYMTGEGGRPHHRRGVNEQASAMGTAIDLWGDNIEITDCDIYSSAACFALKHVHNGFVARNKVRASNLVFISGGSEIIFEDNDFEGNQLTAGGNNIALHFGASSCRHVYYANNKVVNLHGGDHEALTLDGHGTAYIGAIKNSSESETTLAKTPLTGISTRDSMSTHHDVTAYILSGRGAGQYRPVASMESDHVKLAQPWMVAPDLSSVVSIGGFNGNHLIIGNTAQDTGPVVQLYPPNCECIVAENKAIHASNFNVLAKLGVSEDSPFNRAEPSWYNQILDNHVIFGNAWGGGETEIDRWLGGETMLNIWGWCVSFRVDPDGHDQDRQLTASDVAGSIKGSGASSDAIPISRYQVVRRHRIDNNSSIRVRGAVMDCLIEDCSISKSKKGIVIDDEQHREQEEGLDMLNFAAEGYREPGTQPYLSPKLILARKNTFHDVKIRYSGTALIDATVIDPELTSANKAGAHRSDGMVGANNASSQR